MKTLLAHGADASWVSPRGFTAIDAARAAGHEDIVALLPVPTSTKRDSDAGGAAAGARGAVSVAAVPWAFETDYCDHFETPLCAYQDLVPFLSALAASLGKPRSSLQLYDPYWCQVGGDTRVLLWLRCSRSSTFACVCLECTTRTCARLVVARVCYPHCAAVEM